MQFIGQYAKFADYEGPGVDSYGGTPSDYDYPAENSYTVQSKMNDIPEDNPF